MEKHISQIELINQYIDKQLSETERLNFENQLESNPEFITLYQEQLIFIEGLTEKLLLPYFIQQFDNSLDEKEVKLSSQNISIIEVGANAKAFSHFIEFLGIKALIITDIDTSLKTTTTDDATQKSKTTYPASPVGCIRTNGTGPGCPLPPQRSRRSTTPALQHCFSSKFSSYSPSVGYFVLSDLLTK